ncbi:MAG: S8 family serine peptidase [Chitinophagaceae bacterium]
MKRILKIFGTPAELAAIINAYEVIEQYDGFILAEVQEDKVNDISQAYLLEDITDLYSIKTGTGAINTSVPGVTTSGKTTVHPAYTGKDKKGLPPGKHHYLVQFIGPIKDKWLAGIKKAGGELRDPYGDFTYIVRAGEKQIDKITALPFVRWTGHLPYESRIERTLLQKTGATKGSSDNSSVLPRTRQLPGVYTVEFFGPKDVSNAEPFIKKLGFKILAKSLKGKLLIVEIKKISKILDLSMVHGVRRINERVINRTSNDVAAGIMETTLATGNNGSTNLGLSGKGEIIGICDTGLDTGDPNHINVDFAGRIIAIKSYPITPDFDTDITNPGANDGPADLDSGHGTHVAGSVLGNGTNSTGLTGLSGPIRGLAYKAKLVFQAVEQELDWKKPADLEENGRYILAGIPNDLTDLFNHAYQKGARIHSNSWGGGKPGEYDEQCRQLDQFVWNNKQFCVLVAAGNDGTDKDGDGKINLKSITSPATAKNCITVGACENKRTKFNAQHYGDWWEEDYPAAPYKNAPMADNPDEVVAFSSRGPTRDKRFKPDVVAPGTYILSTRSSMIASNNKGWAAFTASKKYFYMGGTSMATPLTAGAVALIREYLRKHRHISRPTAALLKATLIAGAIRLPDNSGVIEVVDNHQGYGRVNIDGILFPASPAASTFIEVKPGLATGAVYSMTINIKSGAVPLRIALAYSDYPGSALVNNLNMILTAPDGKKYTGNQSAGSLTFDSINNAEVIHVNNPSVGNWRVDVVASNVPHGPQDFALVYKGHV